MSHIELSIANSFENEKEKFNAFYEIVRADREITYIENKVFLDNLNLAYDIVNDQVPNFSPINIKVNIVRLNYLIETLGTNGDSHVLDDTALALDMFLIQVGARPKIALTGFHGRATHVMMATVE
jgi:hypothetical protein